MSLAQFLISALTASSSSQRQVSFARLITAVLVGFFCLIDAWYFHRTGHLVDNSTQLTQLSVMTAFYVTNRMTSKAPFRPESSEPTATPATPAPAEVK